MYRLLALIVVLSGCSLAGEAGPKGEPGEPGPAGAAGTNATVQTLAPGDANCPGGGTRLVTGSTVSYACNGAPAFFDNGCPGGQLVQGTCVLAYDNAQATAFAIAAQKCASLGGDLCTDSQAWPLAVGSWQNIYTQPSLLNGPHWLAAFADNDTAYWPGANGGTGDNHGANSSYGYVCCGGYTPANPHVTVRGVNGVKVTMIRNVADTYWAGAVAQCGALRSDLCSDSQTLLIRDSGELTVSAWTNSHSDNDATLYNEITGGTADDTHPSHLHGFACCPSARPPDLSCPVARISGVCAVAVNNVANANFRQAASACAELGADLCSMSQAAVLRTVNALTVPVWTNSHSDNDASNASVAVGAMPDNPALTMAAGYACCLN